MFQLKYLVFTLAIASPTPSLSLIPHSSNYLKTYFSSLNLLNLTLGITANAPSWVFLNIVSSPEPCIPTAHQGILNSTFSSVLAGCSTSLSHPPYFPQLSRPSRSCTLLSLPNSQHSTTKYGSSAVVPSMPCASLRLSLPPL